MGYHTFTRDALWSMALLVRGGYFFFNSYFLKSFVLSCIFYFIYVLIKKNQNNKEDYEK